MSIKHDVGFHLFPTSTGYTLAIDFPYGAQKRIPFVVEQLPQLGTTFDLYSQNGKVEPELFNFFSSHDIKELRSALKVSKPKYHDTFQTLFVLDLKDQNGNYEDAEAIRQSRKASTEIFSN